jgi:hypothetical protein
MGKRLYVGNLSYESTADSIRTAFEAGGRTVTDVFLMIDRETGRPRGFGFVEMGSDDEAQAAIRELDGAELDGRNITVNEARERQGTGGGPRGPRAGGGGFGGGGGSGGGARGARRGGARGAGGGWDRESGGGGGGGGWDRDGGGRGGGRGSRGGGRGGARGGGGYDEGDRW